MRRRNKTLGPGREVALTRRHHAMSIASLLALLAVLVSVVSASSPIPYDLAVPRHGSAVPGHGSALSCALVQGDQPIANAGDNQTVVVGSTVILNASGSQPSDGATIVNYTWSIELPSQTGGGIELRYGELTDFVANKTGLYVANLTIRDSNNLTDWNIAYVVAKEKPKTFVETYLVYILIEGGLAACALYGLVVAVQRRLHGLPIISVSAREKFKLSLNKLDNVNRQLLRNPMGLIGAVLLTGFLLMAALGPMFAPYDIKKIEPENKFQKPSDTHLLGTDQQGVDIFSELLVGARTSIIVGIFSAIIASFLGAAVGLYSGYVGGWKDEVTMRLNDIVLSIPWLVLMIVVAALVGKIDLLGIILIIGLTGWSYTARMVRAQVLSIRERQFVERAKSIGATDLQIIRRHIFPNTFPLVFANTILTVAMAILSEATLSYLRLRPEDAETWGKMLSYASESSALKIGLQGWILVPGICIVLLVLAFTLLGYALDEILNPKLRRR
jgi:peptide/nickel transport system permease protein